MSDPSFSKVFPEIKELDISKIPQNSTYIGTAGFEDRCTTFLEMCVEYKIYFRNIFGIKYEPSNSLNKIDTFESLSEEIVFKKNLHWMTYDRCNPEEFSSSLEFIKNLINSTENLIVDISGMSKFLISNLLYGLRNYSGNIQIIYCEAETYYPSKEEYNNAKNNVVENIPSSFLTTTVHKIVTTTETSSTSMQGYPLLIVAFPTFNYREIYALLDEITPQYLFKIEGIPREPENLWRLDAIRWINRKLDVDFDPNIEGIYEENASTFDYIRTVEILKEIYENYKYTHKFIVSPTGSKLQTVGVTFFKQIHPEIQLVYPVTSEFLREYTEGCKKIWHINIENYNEFMNEIAGIRKAKLRELGTMLHESYVD